MALVVPFYMIFNRKGFRAIYTFMRHRLHHTPLRSFLLTCCSHFRFGQVVIDRFAAYAGRRFKIINEGHALFQHLAEGTDGFVILSSHVGCYELAGYSLRSDSKPFNAVVYGGESPTVTAWRNRILGSHNIRTIAVSPDMSHLFRLNAALDNHEIVSLPADRLFGSRKYVTRTFLGAQARFPMGPFVLASSKEVPMVAVFVMKTGMRGYRIVIRPVGGVDRYVEELEAIVRQYPTQWFNFFDFWSSDN